MPDNFETRTRVFPKVLTGRMTWDYDGVRIIDQSGAYDLSGTQRTVSQGHPISKLGKTDEDLGGDFHTYRSEIVHLSHPRTKVVGPNPFGIWGYEGCLLPLGTAPIKESTLDLRSRESLEAWGTTAISRCSPVNSHSELLTAVAESLKDGIPTIPGLSLWRDRTAIARGAGSEYLNAQFGWVPLVNDIRETTSAMKRAAEHVKQFKRDAGRNVRRRYEFPSETSTVVVQDTGQISNAGGFLQTGGGFLGDRYYADGNSSGRFQHIRETTRKTWFSGAFTYHIPGSDTQIEKVMSAIQQSDLLFGVVPTPDVLWNLTPWSWATDWFANTGDVLTNVSNAMLYGQVLRYGYVMEKTTILDRRYLDLDHFGGPHRIESVVKTTVKRRIRANPFGFGLTYDGLDGYQLSILAALGMTRGHHSALR
jgi:hypothetical protein